MPLPPRPYAVRVTVILRTIFATLVFGLMGVASVPIWFACQKSGDALRRQDMIWQKGIMASKANVQGHEETSHFFDHRYHLSVKYVDQKGKSHNRILECDVFGEVMHWSGPQVVHYLADSPDEFALSAAVEAVDGSWNSVYAALAGGALLLFGSVYGLFLGIRTFSISCAAANGRRWSFFPSSSGGWCKVTA